MLKDSNVISLQISTADIMQQIVWIGSSSIRTVRTFVPELWSGEMEKGCEEW